MKALTIRQPWASLTLLLDKSGRAFKQVETRSRRTNYRGRIAIHAGAFLEPMFFMGMPEEMWAHFRDAGLGTDFAIGKLPYGAVIGEVTIADCLPIEELKKGHYCTEREMAFGDWRDGRYGWILEEPVLYDNPIPARGQLGLWNWGDKG